MPYNPQTRTWSVESEQSQPSGDWREVLNAAAHREPLAAMLYRSDAPVDLVLASILNELARLKKTTSSRILELENIAPKAYRMPNGSIMVWRCPDELIPITEDILK
jgi:hypothetical protein